MERKPAIGDVVRTMHGEDECVAFIVHLWDDERVNLHVLDHSGRTHPVLSAQLVKTKEARQENTWWWPA